MFGQNRQRAAKPGSKAANGHPGEESADPAEDVPAANPVIVFILFETPDVSLESIEPALAKQTILGKRALAMPSGRAAGDTGSFASEIGDLIVAAQVMPVPYPAAELDFAIASAWTWPPSVEATSVRNGASHVLLVVTGGKSTALEKHLVATAVAALIASLPGAVGVYWSAGRVLHCPPFFVDMAAELRTAANPPLYLWVNFCVSENGDDTATLFTTGLGALGLMDMEMHNLKGPPMELREWASSLALHQLVHGPVFQHGDTIGEDTDAQLRVAHAGSSFGLPGTILRLESA